MTHYQLAYGGINYSNPLYPGMPPLLYDSSSVLLPKAQYKVPDNLMKDFMSAVSSTSVVPLDSPTQPITQVGLSPRTLSKVDFWPFFGLEKLYVLICRCT